MNFLLSEDQTAVVATAEKLFATTSPSILRGLRDRGEAKRIDRELWRQLCDLGFPLAATPEHKGGLGLGLAAMGRVLMEAGRKLAPTPFLSTAILGTAALELAGTHEQTVAWLPRIAKGETLLALALDEGPHHRPERIETTVRPEGDSAILEGTKRFVADADVADVLIVVASEAGQTGRLMLLMIDREAPGVHVQPLHMADDRSFADLRFDRVPVPAASVLGGGPIDRATVDAILDRGRACLAAEMLGMALELLEVTVAYLGQREQFGVKIGTFQALRHRAARLFIELELTKSAVFAALAALDAGAADAGLLATLAKARANDVLRLASNEAVQMHGGMGVTDELDIGLYLKRARTAARMLGDSAWLRDRFATLSGY